MVFPSFPNKPNNNFLKRNKNNNNNDAIDLLPTLQDWQVSRDGKLIGTVSGHPLIPDGEVLTTAPLLDPAKVIALQKQQSKNNNNNNRRRRKNNMKPVTVVTETGTQYRLLPPSSTQISSSSSSSFLPFSSSSSSSSSLPISGLSFSTDLPYRIQLAYLEEQMESIQQLARLEQQQEEQAEQLAANLVKGGLATAAVLGAASLINNPQWESAIQQASQATQQSIQTLQSSLQESWKAAVETPQVVLPYLEEQIQALEDQLDQIQQQQQQQVEKKEESVLPSTASSGEETQAAKDSNSKTATTTTTTTTSTDQPSASEVEEASKPALEIKKSDAVDSKSDDSRSQAKEQATGVTAAAPSDKESTKSAEKSAGDDEPAKESTKVVAVQETTPTENGKTETTTAVAKTESTKNNNPVESSTSTTKKDDNTNPETKATVAATTKSTNGEPSTSSAPDASILAKFKETKEDGKEVVKVDEVKVAGKTFSDMLQKGRDALQQQGDATETFDATVKDLEATGKEVMAQDQSGKNKGMTMNDLGETALQVLGKEGVTSMYNTLSDLVASAKKVLGQDEAYALDKILSKLIQSTLKSVEENAKAKIWNDDNKLTLMVAASVVGFAGIAVASAALFQQLQDTRDQTDTVKHLADEEKQDKGNFLHRLFGGKESKDNTNGSFSRSKQAGDDIDPNSGSPFPFASNYGKSSTSSYSSIATSSPQPSFNKDGSDSGEERLTGPTGWRQPSPPKVPPPFDKNDTSSPFGTQTRAGPASDPNNTSSPFRSQPDAKSTPSPLGTKQQSSPFDSQYKPPPQSTNPLVGMTAKAPASPFEPGIKTPTSPFESTPKTPASPFGSMSKTPTSSFGSTPTTPTSPFGSAPKQATSPFGSTPKTPTSPFGSTPKQATSPFESTPKTTTSSFGSSPKQTSSPFQPTPKQATSPFGSIPKQPSSPFGSDTNGPPFGSEAGSGSGSGSMKPSLLNGPTSSSLPGETNLEKSGNDDFAPFKRGPPPNPLFENNPASPFGASINPFGSSEKTAKVSPEQSVFGTPTSNFGSPLPEQQPSNFGAPPPRINNTPNMSEEDEGNKMRQGDASESGNERVRFGTPRDSPQSPTFGSLSGPNSSTYNSNGKTSPFSSPNNTPSKFGGPPLTNREKFGGPPPTNGEKFGGPPSANGAVRFNQNPSFGTSAPGTGAGSAGGFGGTTFPPRPDTSAGIPPSSNSFGSPPQTSAVPPPSNGFGTANQNSARFGSPPGNPGNSNFGAPPVSSSTPFNQAPGSSQSSSNFGSPPSSPAQSFTGAQSVSSSSPSVSRLRPKNTSAPQEDMYERMRLEFEMREEQRKQQGGIGTTNGSDSPKTGINGNTSPPPSNPFPSASSVATPPLPKKESMSDMENLRRLADEARLEEEERLARQKTRIMQEKAERERQEAEQARLAEERRLAEIKAKIAEEKARLEADRARLEEEKRKAEEALREKQRQRAEKEAEDRRKAEERARVEQQRKEEEKARLEKLRQLGKEQARYEAEMKDKSEDEKRQGEQARLEQLRKLAQEQALYEAEARGDFSRTPSSDSSASKSPPEATPVEIINESSSSSKTSNIIDVQGFRLDEDGVIVQDVPEDKRPNQENKRQQLEEEARARSQKFQVGQQRQAAEQREQAKRRTLEEQARQRAQMLEQERIAKQQQAYEEKRRQLSEQLALEEEKARIMEERARLEEEAKRRAEQEKIQLEEAKKQEAYNAIADTLAQADNAYLPSKQALENPLIMLQEVTGPPLDAQYVGKEGYFTGRNVQIYSGRTESVPVRISVPGTFVEFTIDKKAYDFGLEIVAFLDNGKSVTIKPNAPFSKYSGRQNHYEDRLLIGAGSAPCQLQFRFHNTYRTLLEKVVMSYRIKVTSPPKELVLKGRRTRAEACMRSIEEELTKSREAMAKISGQKDYLEEDIAKLKRSIMKKSKMVTTIKDEERRWGALLEKLKSGKVRKKPKPDQEVAKKMKGKESTRGSSEETKSQGNDE
jgi:hypothetical protein